jgi:hypothetical protein
MKLAPLLFQRTPCHLQRWSPSAASKCPSFRTTICALLFTKTCQHIWFEILGVWESQAVTFIYLFWKIPCLSEGIWNLDEMGKVVVVSNSGDLFPGSLRWYYYGNKKKSISF